MSGFAKKVARAWSRILMGAVFLGAPLMLCADEVIPDELRRCSLIDDSSARLACYDAFSGRKSPAPSTSSLPRPREPLEEKTLDVKEVDKKEVDKKTPDDLGSETLPMGARGEVEKLEVRARISRCEKDLRKKYLFYFDNGQIWKQKSDKKLYFKDCNFDVTITKDFFGYKMKADGEKGRIRISRVK